MARKRKKKRAAYEQHVQDSAPETTETVEQAEQEAAEDVTDEATAETESDLETAADEEDVVEVDVEVDQAGELEKELAEMRDKYMRSLADAENVRKRRAKEIEDTRRNSRISTLEEIMPVMDQFQMAMAAIDSATDMETMKMGMNMIQNTFNQCFENLGVEKIPTAGLEFDPNLHEAISMEASEDVPVDHIIREWKAGYKLGDYLLRAPSVVVSSGPAEEDGPETIDGVEAACDDDTEVLEDAMDSVEE